MQVLWTNEVDVSLVNDHINQPDEDARVACYGLWLRVLHRPFLEFGLLGQLTGPAIPTHISKSSSVGGLGAGLFTAWADPDHGWESNVSGEAAF